MNKRDKAALKESGIQWVGEIPNEWDVIRLKNSVEGCFNGIWGDDPDEGYFDTPCIRVADFDRTNNSVSLKKLTMRKIELASSNPRFLKRGDLLIEKSGGGEQSPVGNVVIFNHRFKAVCSNFVGRLPIRSQHSSHYWNYVHQSIYAIRLNTCSIKQNTGIQNLDTTQYLDERVPSPPLIEQRQIAVYLNRETAKIDKLIAKQQKLIKLLQEKRQAVISQAVTKGLDPNVKMKDSGVEWLGDVPEPWSVRKLCQISVSIGDGLHGTPTYDDLGPVFFVNGNNLNGRKVQISENTRRVSYLEAAPQNGMLKVNAVLLSINGTIGNTAIWDGEQIMLGKSIAFINPIPQLDSRYLSFFLSTSQAKNYFNLSVTGTTISNLGLAAIRSMRVPLPTLLEQRNIVSDLNQRLNKFDDASTRLEQQKSLLLEHRQALITAAVTGKIDVRGLVTDEEVAALDAEPEVETKEEDFASDVLEDSYITEEE